MEEGVTHEKPGFFRLEAGFFKGKNLLNKHIFSLGLSTEGDVRTDQAGLLTCGSQRTSRLPGLSFQPSGILGDAPHLQWPDRPGFTPGSLFTPRHSRGDLDRLFS